MTKQGRVGSECVNSIIIESSRKFSPFRLQEILTEYTNDNIYQISADQVSLRHCVLQRIQRERNATEVCRNLLKVMESGDPECLKMARKTSSLSDKSLFDRPASFDR